MGARFSAPVQTGPEAHPASCTVGTGSFPGVKSGKGVTLTLHLILVPSSRKSRAIPLLPLWAVRPVQSLSACTRVRFSFTFMLIQFRLRLISLYTGYNHSIISSLWYKIDLNYIRSFSPYRAVNTFHLGYKNQPVYAISGKSRCLFSDTLTLYRRSADRSI